MSALRTLKEAREAGLLLSISPAGKIAYRGPREIFERFAPVLRSERDAILDALTDERRANVERLAKKEFADWLKRLLSQVWVRRDSMHIVRGFSEGASQRSDQCYRAGCPELISRFHCVLLEESSKLLRFCWDSKQKPREAYRGLRSSSTCALTSYYQTPILLLVV